MKPDPKKTLKVALSFESSPQLLEAGAQTRFAKALAGCLEIPTSEVHVAEPSKEIGFLSAVVIPNEAARSLVSRFKSGDPDLLSGLEPFVLLGAQTADGFPVTRGSLVARATADAEEIAFRARGELFQLYWLPLFVTALKRYPSDFHEVQDVTQAFLAQFLTKKKLAQFDAVKGRFRSLLRRSYSRFWIDHFRKKSSQKAGGGAHHVPIDAVQLESEEQDTADELFDLVETAAVLRMGLNELEKQYAARHDEAGFLEALEYADSTASWEKIGEAMGLSAGAAIKRVTRLRERLGQILAELAESRLRDGCSEGDISNELKGWRETFVAAGLSLRELFHIELPQMRGALVKFIRENISSGLKEDVIGQMIDEAIERFSRFRKDQE